MTKKLQPLTLPDSGEVIMIFPVSMYRIITKLQRENPKPLPPMVKVTIAGVETVEPNYADPDYPGAIKAWEAEITAAAIDRILYRVALKQELSDDQKADVVEFRAAMEDSETLPQNDKMLWFFEFALMTDNDIKTVMEAVSALADPTEKGIQAKADSFQSDV